MYTCKIGNLSVGKGLPVRIMGVINCSPESFFSGSYVEPKNLHSTALKMAEEGADLIDIGARSTAPGSPEISIGEEITRITSALREIEGTGIPVSVDTMHHEVLSAALRYDIDAINDIAGFSNSKLGKTAADAGLPAILMAAFEKPGDQADVPAIYNALEIVSERCTALGIDEFVLDPGVGKWTDYRTADLDWDICRNYDLFAGLERPLLAAVSRKSFLGEINGRNPSERLAGSLAVTYYLVTKGASMVRTHDVGETSDMIKVIEKLSKYQR